VQQEFFRHFREYVSQEMLQAMQQSKPIPLFEAEQKVRQRLEEELLHLHAEKEHPKTKLSQK
jgi:hypothetical protein